MHHSLIRQIGFWRDGAPLEPWEAEQFDAAQADGVNGDDGESFDADTQIAIGGGGLVVTAPFRASDCRRLSLAPSTQFTYAIKSFDRLQRLERGTPEEPDDWALQVGSTWRPHWYQLELTTSRLWVPLSLPVGSTLTEVRMTIRGAAHGSWPPASFPKISIAIGDYDDITPGIASTTTDAPASQGIYEDWHTVTRSGAHVVDANKYYWARIEGESGTNSEVGLRILTLRASVTMTAKDVWIP